MRELYFGLDGKPITRDEWVAMRVQREAAYGDEWVREEILAGERFVFEPGKQHYRPEADPTRMAETTIDKAWVSTVWVGLDMGYTGDPPIIFETMIFGGDHDEFCERYATKEAALAGHDRVVAALRAGKDPSRGTE